jgi:hypothetical protein
MNEHLRGVTRRHFFGQCGFGIGTLALSQLEAQTVTRAPHFAPNAKNIIFLFMAGAPSQLDLFDYKPKLTQFNGQPVPADVIKGERFAFIKGVPKLLGTPHSFARHGQSGAELSNLLPYLADIADDVSFIKSMHTTQFNHAPGQVFMNTGHQIVGRPSLGSWLTYGIGSDNSDLPGFVVLLSGKNRPDGGTSCWGSGFLPSFYQGVDPQLETRIAGYEMAYRMQSSVPDLTDISKEPAKVHEMYGTAPGEATFANNCLLARRLVERGVRFVQLYHRGWDTHGASNNEDIVNKLAYLCRETDRAASALVADLKQRGLLDSTLVVWSGEFGRTPMNEERSGSKFLGRDDIGYNVADDPVSVHDLHATILHLMGLDHTKLTHKFQGREFRLTDVHGEVVRKLLV